MSPLNENAMQNLPLTPSDLVPESALTRRRFVSSLGATIASLAVQACAKPPRGEIVPYVERPAELTPGVARFYATSTSRCGYGFGLLAESHEGRPTKVEGHPAHPASLGATSAREQASILTFYDPDRARSIKRGRDVASFRELAAAMADRSPRWSAARGDGLALLLEPSASPLRQHLIDRLRDRFPALALHYTAPWAPLSAWEGARRAFGRPLDVQYRFEQADVAVALNADFLVEGPMSVRFSHDFMQRRKPGSAADAMNRLYAIESHLSPTGAVADHRLAIRASESGAIAGALLALVSRARSNAALAPISPRAQQLLGASRHREWLDKLSRDLLQHRGRAVVIAGIREAPEVHVLVHAINALLDAPGQVLWYSESALPNAGSSAYDLQPLFDRLDSPAVETLLILGANPNYELAPGASFASRMLKAKERLHLSLYANESSEHATWFVPETHYLERWGDARAYDGTVSFTQPLIEPLYASKSAEQVLALLLGDAAADGREILERYSPFAKVGAARSLDDLLREGVLPETAFVPVRSPALSWPAVADALARITTSPESGLELEFTPGPHVGFGELSNNAWLQELPDSITQTVWGNAALIAPELAARSNVNSGDVVELRRGSARVRLPAVVQPGQAPDVITVWLGYGRRGSESVARGVGVDVNPLRLAGGEWRAGGTELHKLEYREAVTFAQTADRLHGRPIVLRRSRQDWQRDPDFASEHNHDPVSILPDRLHGAPQWGMAIDLNACVGCSACVIACQAENNIPTVGKQNMALGREMQWLRIDRYYERSSSALQVDFQPMLCQHCEKAPCEYVCPVNATVHSPDGLNEMVYNRCVGTRFCSNNCPYKVRRFNFFEYNGAISSVEKLGKNPDVTIRARGVMEKCTYCVQRIRRAEIDARVERRAIRNGEVHTACEQACPSGAIVFGLVSDRNSRVSELHSSPRAYAALNDVGTRPRTRYLARISNPNPEYGT